jgi:hypothetical protein
VLILIQSSKVGNCIAGGLFGVNFIQLASCRAQSEMISLKLRESAEVNMGVKYFFRKIIC